MSNNTPVSSNAPASSNDGFERVLGRKDLFAIAIGMIIGAGVMTLTGIGIGRTGRSVCISYLLATFFALFHAVPTILTASIARFKGAGYTTWAVFVGPRWCGAYLILYFMCEIGVCMYALSFAEYFAVLVPGVSQKLVAIIVATVFFVLNFFGINIFTKVEKTLTVFLLAAIVLYIVCGMPHVQWDTFFTNPGFTTHGLSGIFAGAAFLNYAVLGATTLMSFSAECKNPKKDIPFTIIISTASVAILFSLLSIVASGVLPVDSVINKPLTLVGEIIFNRPLFLFFLIAGALGATATTLNVTIAYITKPLVFASRDGWFPAKMGELHPKYHTPHRWLFVWYLITILPLALDFSVSQIADLCMFIMYLSNILYYICYLKMPKKFGEQWKKSPYHIPDWAFYCLIIFCAGLTCYQLIANAMYADPKMLMINGIVLVAAIVYSELRYRSGKVHMNPSWEDA